jgi:phosphatidylglycerophosphate synthase
MRSSPPTIAELRACCQPGSIMGRVSGEHWAGRLYMRHASLYLTRALLPTRLTPNAITWLMIASGLGAAAVLAVPHVWAAVLAVLLIQAQLIFDCSDGEIARWRGVSSPVGIYLDRIGHFFTDSAMVAALGVRASGGYIAIGGWTTLGLAVAVLSLWIKSETQLVHVARAHAGLGLLSDEQTAMRPRGLASLRAIVARAPIHRALLAIELSGLVLLAAIGDAASGTLLASRVLLAALAAIALLVVAGHLLSVLTSRRLS